MKVVIVIADKPNRNGRIYPRSELEQAIADKDAGVCGTIGMPEGDIIGDIIGNKEASHVVRNLRFEGDALVGDVEILDTPKGDELREILQHTSLDFRTCGFGDNDAGVVRNFVLTSINAVENGA